MVQIVDSSRLLLLSAPKVRKIRFKGSLTIASLRGKRLSRQCGDNCATACGRIAAASTAGRAVGDREYCPSPPGARNCRPAFRNSSLLLVVYRAAGDLFASRIGSTH